ncbi:MAG TPA: efflux RND transporter periplasmic adaptor subunit [Steroidobacteraceae bacterium]|nr:efflux RND transporter periplasmic adaptor subunit [Steroidobacteraceae bacterium]
MNDTVKNDSSPAGPAAERTRERVGRQRLGWIVAVAAVAALSALVLMRAGRGGARARAAAARIPAVSVVRVEREDLFNEINVPAEFRPYQEVDLHAKVAGYVRDMRVDIGDRVKAGDLIARLEVPELDAQLAHDVAVRERAQAAFRDAHLDYTRLLAANRQHANLIAQQDIDSAEAKDRTAAAALGAATADVRKDRTLMGYTRITAPFDGVITKRYADPGALIQAGTSSDTQAKPLVRLSELRHLRLDFPVSVDYVSSIRDKEPITVRVQSLGGRTITATIVRFTDRVDSATRTMTVEADVDNRNMQIVPGMYATVSFRVADHPDALAVPVAAVPSGSTNVLIVDRAHQVEQRAVTLGIETPTMYEVRSGLDAGDLVVIGNAAQLVTGERVEPRLESLD